MGNPIGEVATVLAGGWGWGSGRGTHDFLFLTIRDLDNGAEFVLDDHCLLEVATNLNLTMKEFELTLGHSSIIQKLMHRHTIVAHLLLGFRHTSSEWGGRRSSFTIDDSQEASFQLPERVFMKQYGKSCKEVHLVDFNSLRNSSEFDRRAAEMLTNADAADNAPLPPAYRFNYPEEDLLDEIAVVVRVLR
ncbi:hypothetical protein Fmac_019101 [Flemingia macrophylla]|uniref:Uncharacterized protein n=1 Tax=Flemingia macrophylla TaxID=520843 RepID=A0ABD1M8T3_9FABA